MENESHTIHLENRNDLKICGVVDVENFNEEIVIIVTEFGVLNVTGKELKISELAEGKIHISGSIYGLNYNPEHKKKERLLGKIFK